jgi:diacylglycerol O-acyltransferase / wax synthase
VPAGRTQRPGTLSYDDARILRLESPSIKAHTCKVMIVEPGPGGPIELDRLRERVAARIGRMPRARERVAFAPHDGDPAWVEDTGFDLEAHVVRMPIEGPIDRDRLRAIAGELMAERLDHERPLWRLDLVSPLEDGGAAIVMRVHHAMADGITTLRFARAILWDEPPAAASSSATPGAAEPSTASRAGGSEHRMRSLARMPGALARELVPRAQDSPLDRRIGSEREVAFAGARLEDLKAIERSVGDRLGRRLTVNDVFLGAVAGSLRGWLEAAGSGVKRLRVQVPVSLHHREEGPDALGNRDSFMNVDLPLGEPDAVRRLALINAETAKRKLRGDADEMYSFLHGLGHLGPLGRAGSKLASGPREFSLAVSNVPGPREPVSVLGGRIAELYSLAEPADRHALRVTGVSCAGTMGFGLCTDPEALDDLAPLAAGIERSVAELLDRC